MRINPNKINENLLVLISVELISLFLFISLNNFLIIWFCLTFVFNSLAIYFLIKYKPNYYILSITILFILFIITIILIIQFAIAFEQILYQIENT